MGFGMSGHCGAVRLLGAMLSLVVGVGACAQEGASVVRAFLEKYCVDCHSDDL